MTEASFIVPALNEEEYIEDCLKSIVTQRSCVDFELIVVDGDSKDNTPRIAKKYANKVLSVPEPGIWLARNKGALIAKGELLIFIDADTAAPPNYLEAIHAVLEDEEISALSCAFRFDRRSKSLKIIQDMANNYLLTKSLIGQGELLGFNAAMSRRAFSRTGGFPRAPLEDAAMAKKLRHDGKLVYLPEPRVITSSRRIYRGGILNAVMYYASLGLVTDFPASPTRYLARYRKYIPVR